MKWVKFGIFLMSVVMLMFSGIFVWCEYLIRRVCARGAGSKDSPRSGSPIGLHCTYTKSAYLRCVRKIKRKEFIQRLRDVFGWLLPYHVCQELNVWTAASACIPRKMNKLGEFKDFYTWGEYKQMLIVCFSVDPNSVFDV